MEFTALERMPDAEIARRHARCRALMQTRLPEAGGLLVFSKINIYYLSGVMTAGVFWLPVHGEPALLMRRGLARARLESPLATILPFRSYSDVPGLLAEAGCPLSRVAATEMSGLSWSLGNLLASRLKGVEFAAGDQIPILCRSVKSEWELAKLRLAGERHNHCMREVLPGRLKVGMSERQVAHLAWEAFFEAGHSGHMRLGAFGEEIFLGHVAAGESANYPSVYNGPVGLRGEHPAVPFMGYAGKIWREDEPLVCDIGFCLEGYQSDKTQIYWPGERAGIPADLAAAHACCLDIQAYLAENLKPGAIPSQLYQASLAMAEKAGFAEGYMALGDNKVKFVGHGIGLVIDEHPVLAAGFDEPLEAGMVLALEPKIGVAGKGMVGAENTFEVTDQGGVCLTGNNYDILCLKD